MIYVVDARSDWGITPSDQLILGNYGAEIGAFISAGGGFFSNTQYNKDMAYTIGPAQPAGGQNYQFLAKMAPFISLGYTGATGLQTPSLTALGAANFPSLVSSAPINPNIQGQWHQCAFALFRGGGRAGALARGRSSAATPPPRPLPAPSRSQTFKGRRARWASSACSCSKTRPSS